MTRDYEMVYIFDSALEEDQINERLDKHHALLKSPDNAEPIRNVNHWGTRTLAYPIKKRETGYYVVADFDCEPPLLGEFERSVKLDEGIIRYLLVINEGEVPAPRPERDSDDGGPRVRTATAAPGATAAPEAAAAPAVAAEPTAPAATAEPAKEDAS
jgi:small subunit ribosomal protein S6